MLDSYEVGQRLIADDFADMSYFPSAKWDYAEVVAIDDDAVTLLYVDGATGNQEACIWTKGEMEEMLGWSVGDGDVFDEIDDRDDRIAIRTSLIGR